MPIENITTTIAIRIKAASAPILTRWSAKIDSPPALPLLLLAAGLGVAFAFFPPFLSG
jgi:hypothetical protein